SASVQRKGSSAGRETRRNHGTNASHPKAKLRKPQYRTRLKTSVEASAAAAPERPRRAASACVARVQKTANPSTATRPTSAGGTSAQAAPIKAYARLYGVYHCTM